METEAQLRTLYSDLDKFGPNDACPWPLAVTFNVLLEAAKKEAPDNPVVAAIEPAEEGAGGSYATMNTGALAGLTNQLRRALSRD